MIYIIGNNLASNIVNTSPVIPITISTMESLRKVSRSVNPHILQTIQKPASFIQGNIFEPHPITAARYTG